MHKGHQLCRSQKNDYKVIWPQFWPMKHLTVAIKVGNVLRSLLQRIEVSHLPKGGCGLLCLWASEGYKATREVQKLGLGLFGCDRIWGVMVYLEE